MGSLCPVLTLSPEPSAVAKEKGAVGVFLVETGEPGQIVRAGCLDCVRSGRKKPEIPDRIWSGIWGKFRLERTEKKDLRGFSLSSPAHSFFVHLCFDFSFMSCCICIGTKKREEREYRQGEQFSQGGMTA